MSDLRSRWTFLREFISRPSTVGAVSPSSIYLAEEMVSWVDWKTIRKVVELGPGTGVFTEAILRKAGPECRYLAVEISPGLAAIFRSRFPRLRLARESVSNLAEICAREGMSEVDLIVSGLPWASFPSKDQIEYLDGVTAILRQGGGFCTFAYLQGLLLGQGRAFRRRLHDYFGQVAASRVVWKNVPPAFVYRCRR
ncbi:MAG TPA: methyltransferase domain-containing protein [Candidatus Polarisedimenticolia bacterium]|nr:methyltransferase domain-containing protein [Candidatus Polarisedimenticolia bacterium]